MKYKKIFIIFLVLLFVILYNITRAKEKWKDVSEGLPNKFIKDIKTDKKTVYIATANGLVIYDNAGKKITRVLQKEDGLGDNYISSLAVDKDYIWIGTDNGLGRYEKKTGEIVNYTEKDGLVNNEVSAVAVDGDFIWVGTKTWGISRYDKVVNTWKTFNVMNGIIDNSINCITVEGEYVWVGSQEGLSYYDKIIGMWGGYDTTQGLKEGNINSIETAGQYLWLGTVNGLIRFDKYEQNFKVYTTSDGLADDVIWNLKLDGFYLWIGTFSGVTKYNVIQDKWYTYTEKDGLIDNSVSCLEVDGNYIWFGTDGAGISIFDKEIPQALISPFSYYSKPGEIVIFGTAFDYDNIDSYKIEYKNDTMPDFLLAGVKVLSKMNVIMDKLAFWDVNKLINVYYDVRLTVTDKKGNKNIAISSIVVDTKAPEITLNLLPEAVKRPTEFIKGTFIDGNISKILIDINNGRKEKAELNRMLKQYSKEIQLKKGKNNITITAYDVANLSNQITASIVYDKEKPVITLKEYPATTGERNITLEGDIVDSGIQRVVLTPGNVEILFIRNKDDTFSFSHKVSLEPGFNKFRISAYDYVGNKAEVNPVIEYTSTLPIVKIYTNILRVSKADYVVKGEWSDDNIDYIMIEEPFNKKARIDMGKRTFSAAVKLKKGENVITVTVFDKDKNQNFHIVKVMYSTEKIELEFVDLPDYTFQKSFKLKGNYNEPNLDKIILNPGEMSVSVNQGSKTFSFTLNLNEGANNYEVVIIDRLGTKISKKFSIVLDSISPMIELTTIPTTVYSEKLKVSGGFIEENIESIIIQPGDIKCKLDKEYNTFSGTIILSEGKNELQIIASDKAGNKSSESREVAYLPKAIDVSEVEKVDPRYLKRIQELEDKIESLKRELRSSQSASRPVSTVSTVVYKKEKEFSLPRKNGLALVPFSKLKMSSLLEISKKYLGNYMYISFINKYNNTPTSKKNNTILLPTKRFINDYIKIRDKKIKNILDIIAISYKSSGNSHSSFKQKLSFNLFKKNIINKIDFNFLIKISYLKGKEFLISINKNKKGISYPYVINVTYSRSFMDINVKRNKLYGRK